METLAADFALLYPPNAWIPAFAGMTKGVEYNGAWR
jgi:hypothetical protein